MAPLLFIGIVSLILIALLYWILRTSDSDSKRPRSYNTLQWEAAEEITNTVDYEIYLADNSMKLIRLKNDQVIVYWNFSNEKWQADMAPSKQAPKNPNLMLRVYQTQEWLKTWDMPIKHKRGSMRFTLPVQTFCYCSIGYKENGSFTPILTSNTIMLND